MVGEAAEMPFLDHREELRKRIIWSLLALVALSIVGFFMVTELNILAILERPFQKAAAKKR